MSAATVPSPTIQPTRGDEPRGGPPSVVDLVSITSTSQVDDSPSVRRSQKKQPSVVSSDSANKKARRSFDDRDEDWVPPELKKSKKSSKSSRC